MYEVVPTPENKFMTTLLSVVITRSLIILNLGATRVTSSSYVNPYQCIDPIEVNSLGLQREGFQKTSAKK